MSSYLVLKPRYLRVFLPISGYLLHVVGYTGLLLYLLVVVLVVYYNPT